jgi:hypothetical protein
MIENVLPPPDTAAYPPPEAHPSSVYVHKGLIHIFAYAAAVYASVCYAVCYAATATTCAGATPGAVLRVLPAGHGASERGVQSYVHPTQVSSLRREVLQP